LRPDEVNLATISRPAPLLISTFRRVAPGWCATRPKLVRWWIRSFSAPALRAPNRRDLTQAGNSFCAEALQSPLIC
jgi:hypothetical protein